MYGAKNMKRGKRTSSIELKIFLLRHCLKPAHLYEIAKEEYHYFNLHKCALELVAVGLLEVSVKVKKVKHRLSSEPKIITQRIFMTSERGHMALEFGERFLTLLKLETKEQFEAVGVRVSDTQTEAVKA